MILFKNSKTNSYRVQSKVYDLLLQGLLSHSVNEITVDNLQKVQNKLVLLDAREPQEFKISHIKDAVPVGCDHFSASAVNKLKKQDAIAVYCSVGYRSEKIVGKLQKMGFKNVYNLYGGIFEWINQGKQVVNEFGPTENVHPFNRMWSVWLEKGEKTYK